MKSIEELEEEKNECPYKDCEECDLGNSIRIETLKEVLELIDELFYIKGVEFPIVSVNKVIELKQRMTEGERNGS